MVQFKAFTANAEVNGETVLSVVDGLGAFKKQASDILMKNGINNPQPGQWYSQQAWLNAFKEIAEKIGARSLNAIGKKIPQNAKFPPGIDTIDKALASIDVAYHMNNRNGEIGYYKYEKTSAKSGRMICKNPFPCDFDRGIIEAMAQRFKPADSVMVMVDHDKTKSCRKNGAESCEYIITW